MHARKRPSLADFARQEGIGVSKPEQPKPKAKSRPVKGAAEAKRVESPVRTAKAKLAPAPSPKSETRNPKSDFVKVSVTLPPELHEKLLDLSRERRKRKQPYMISDLVREALAGWMG